MCLDEIVRHFVVQDAEPEKPAWMKEAMAKKRRSLDLLQLKGNLLVAASVMHFVKSFSACS